MDIVTLDQSFPLASFQGTGPNQLPKKVLVEPYITTHFSTPDSGGVEGAKELGLVVATVPGEGIHLYETINQQHLNSWSVPSSTILLGSAKLLILNSNPIKKKNNNPSNLSDLSSENGVETELSSLIDTKDFYLLNSGYYLYQKIGDDSTVFDKVNGATTNTVWVWSKGGKKVEIKFKDKVRSIYPLGIGSKVGESCLVVFGNGLIRLYSPDLKTIISKTKLDAPIQWSRFSPINKAKFLPTGIDANLGGCLMVITTEKHNQTLHLIGVRSDVQKYQHLEKIASCELGPKSESEQSLSFRFSSGRLAILDSSLSLRTLQLSFPKMNSIEVIGNKDISLNLTTISHLKLRNVVPKKDSISGWSFNLPSITFISPDHLMLLASFWDEQKNVISSSLVLWDIKLGVVLKETHLQDIDVLLFKNKNENQKHHSQHRTKLNKIYQKNMIISSVTCNSLLSDQPRSTELILIPFICPNKSNLLSSMNKLDLSLKYLDIKNLDDKKLNSSSILPPDVVPITVAGGKVCKVSDLNHFDVRHQKDILNCESIEDTFNLHCKELEALTFALKDPKLPLWRLDAFPFFVREDDKFRLDFEYPDIKHLTNLPKSQAKIHSKNMLEGLVENWAVVKSNQYYNSLAQEYMKVATQYNLMSPRYISYLVNNLVNDIEDIPDMTCYSSKVMGKLIQSSKVTSSTFKASHGGLLPVLLARQDWENVQLALVCTNDLSEHELVLFLKMVFKSYEDLVNDARPYQRKTAKYILEAYLVRMLSYNFDAKLMRFSLNLLDDKQIHIYLPLLNEMLMNNLTNSNILWKSSIYFIKMYELFSSILDVHFTTIVAMSDFNNFLHDVQRMVKNRLKAISLFDSFEPKLLKFRKIEVEDTNLHQHKKVKVDNKLNNKIKVKVSHDNNTIEPDYKVEEFNLF